LSALQVEVTKYEELEDVHAELRLKQLLWDSLDEWDTLVATWKEVNYSLKSEIIPLHTVL
jgi:hypothetical protein